MENRSMSRAPDQVWANERSPIISNAYQKPPLTTCRQYHHDLLRMRLTVDGVSSNVLRFSRRFPLLLVVCCFACLDTASPARSDASPCPNETVRGESFENPVTHAPFSTQLPDCRAYELVSPPDTLDLPAVVLEERKGVGATMPPIITPSGAVLYPSEAIPPGTGAVANGRGYNVFLSSRSPGGWGTTDLDPSGAPGDSELVAASTDGSRALIVTAVTLTPNDMDGQGTDFAERRDFYLVSATHTPVLVSHGALERGVPSLSGGVCGPLGINIEPGGPVFCLPGKGISFNPELTAVGFSSSASLDPGLPETTNEGPLECYTWSDSGEQRAVFTDFRSPLGGPEDGCEQLGMLPDGQPVFESFDGGYRGLLFVSGNGSNFPEGATQISGGTPGAASFDVVSPDGKIVYLTSTDQLSKEKNEGKPEVYAVHLPEVPVGIGPPLPGSVSCLSCPDGSGAVFVGQSADGSHVFFSSSEGLWSWDAQNRVAGRLTSDTEVSQLIFSQNGEYAVGLTKQLVVNPNGTADVYEFSAGRSPTLITSGASADAYALRRTYPPYNPISYVTGGVSNDGARIVYEDTPAGGGLAIVQEYSGGVSRQISPVGATASSRLLGTAGSELQDVFLTEEGPLVPQDRNGGVLDIYDARVGGGFPHPQPPASEYGTPNPIDLASSSYPGNLTALARQPSLLPVDTSSPPVTAKPKGKSCRTALRIKKNARKRRQALKRCVKPRKANRRHS
jgi:hypothetical protein